MKWNKNREMLMHIIEHFPAIRYKELMSISGLSYGTVSYHLRVLEKNGLIKVERKSNVTRFYPQTLKDLDYIVMKVARNKTRREIIRYLISKEESDLDEIASYVNKRTSTVRWHMNILYRSGIINIERSDRRVYYSIKYKEQVSNILIKYSSCLIDNDRSII